MEKLGKSMFFRIKEKETKHRVSGFQSYEGGWGVYGKNWFQGGGGIILYPYFSHVAGISPCGP